MNEINPTCRIDHLSPFYDFHATVDVLRLDLMHPVVSGNKWFKLKEYLTEAKAEQKTILTFGGAFSNHIAATAAATKSSGVKSIGIIRGEEPRVLSHTLQQARNDGMELHFISRDAYKQKIIPADVFRHHRLEDLCIVPEGGYGLKGVNGAREILLQNDTSHYTHIVSAVGTGTTLAGLAMAAGKEQMILGISVLKDHFSLEKEIRQLLSVEKQQQFAMLHDYHFGGYAKQNGALFRFMNSFFEKTGIPTDFVYTAKAFFAVFDLLQKGFFAENSKILLVHTGGLQGNLSLPKGTLIFH
jgi:1-aminocyclopropane-1-carboxylate deaminase